MQRGAKHRACMAGALSAMVLTACGGGSGDSSDAAGEVPPDQLAQLRIDTSQWPDTDFSNATVPLSEFLSGGPPKDGIPSVDDPKFVGAQDEDLGLQDGEPVAVLTHRGVTRAYPVRILTRHEIVNDEIGGDPIAVTYCPLCNSTVAFIREVDGEPTEFGTTGNLRNSDLVMYDRRTESWWQQLTARGVVGEQAGTELEVLPTQILAWDEFVRQHPDGEVLSRDTGFGIDYGDNPYPLYDVDPNDPPFLLDRSVSDALPPKERVTAVGLGSDERVVYPFTRLKDERVVNDSFGGEPIVVLHDPEVSSALDARTVPGGRAVGGSGVFIRRADGGKLTFETAPADGGSARFRDTRTGSIWNVSGLAVSGELEGTQLEAIPSDDQFWFAVAAFFEDPEIRD